MTLNLTVISVLSFFHSKVRTDELSVQGGGAIVKYGTSRGIEHTDQIVVAI